MWKSLWLAACAALFATLATVASSSSERFEAPRPRQATRWLWRDHSIAVSPNGEWVAVHVSKDGWRRISSQWWGAVWLLNLASGEARVLESGIALSVKAYGLDCVAFSPDSNVLAVCGSASDYHGPFEYRNPVLSDYAVQLWDVSTGEELPGLMPRKATGPLEVNDVGQIAFSADGNYLAASPWGDVSVIPPFLHGSDDMVHLWELPKAQRVQLLTSYHGYLFGLAFSPDSVHLALAVHKHLLGKTHISLLDVQEREEVHRFECGGNCAGPVFSPDGKILAAVTWHGIWALARLFPIRFWDVDTGEKLADVPSAPWPGSSSAIFVPRSHTLAVREPDDTIAFWDAPSGREVRRLAFPEGAPAVFVFTPDGKALIGGGPETTPVLHMWDANTAKELQHWDLAGLFPQEMKVGKPERAP
jgi:WD40 repeat protein